MTHRGEPIEAWRAAWRIGFAPQFTDAELESLAAVLADASASGDVESCLTARAAEASRRLGEPGAARRLLDWWGTAPRSEACAALLAEILVAQLARSLQPAGSPAA